MNRWVSMVSLACFASGAVACQSTPASPVASSTSESAGQINEHAVLKYVLPALKSAGKAGRIYYQVTCSGGLDDPIPFPKMQVKPPVAGATGVTAIRQIFGNSPSVRVAETDSGIVRITISTMPAGILDTRISVLSLDPTARYNSGSAIDAILNTKEVLSTIRRLGLKIPLDIVNRILTEPSADAPRLPPSMANLTTDEALDSVAQTFKGVVLYKACANKPYFGVEFAGGVYFDEALLNSWR